MKRKKSIIVLALMLSAGLLVNADRNKDRGTRAARWQQMATSPILRITNNSSYDIWITQRQTKGDYILKPKGTVAMSLTRTADVLVLWSEQQKFKAQEIDLAQFKKLADKHPHDALEITIHNSFWWWKKIMHSQPHWVAENPKRTQATYHACMMKHAHRCKQQLIIHNTSTIPVVYSYAHTKRMRTLRPGERAHLPLALVKQHIDISNAAHLIDTMSVDISAALQERNKHTAENLYLEIINGTRANTTFGYNSPLWIKKSSQRHIRGAGHEL
jgi:hypothetical protein